MSDCLALEVAAGPEETPMEQDPDRVDVADPARLATIDRLDLTGRRDDPDLNAAVLSLTAGTGAPMAAINIITPNRQTYLASVGLDVPCTHLPDDLSFCTEVVRTGQGLQVPDSTNHPVYADNPFVLEGGVRSYAGEPLIHAGHIIGAIGVFDTRPRTFTRAQIQLLQGQARLTAAVIALRSTVVSDGLTGLPSRARLLDRVQAALDRAQPASERIGLLVLDVAGMTRVNETVGSQGGDSVLRAVAARMTAACAATDQPARLGGDKFAILFGAVASVDEARARTAAIVAAVSGPLDVDGTAVTVQVRFGLSTTPAVSADALLASAERAATTGQRRSTQAGAGVVLSTQAEELRAAIDAQQLVLRYHPVVNLHDGQIRGVEALVRWQHPTRGLLPPSEFIALAEEAGLIDQLGTWVLRTAATQAARWYDAGRPLDVAVNLSPLQMSEPQLAGRIGDVLAEVGVRPQQIILEVTESAVIDQPQAGTTLEALRDLGIRLALDDFGTGYASLSYLRRFPIDIVKIDRSFVAGLGRHHDDDAIVESVVSLARNTGKAVVAEGVETEEQSQLLKELGVQQGQGFLWTRPLPAAELMDWAVRSERDGAALDGRSPRIAAD